MDRQLLARIAVQRRMLFTLLSLLFGGLLASGILFTQFNTTLSALLTASDPYLAELTELDSQFPVSLQVTYALVPKQGSVFNSDVLAALDYLDQRYTQLPLATRLSSLLNYRSPESFQLLFERSPSLYNDAELAEVQAHALNDTLLTSNLLTSNAELTFAVVSIDTASIDAAQRLEIAEAALQLQAQMQLDHPELDIYVNSEVLFEHSSREAMVSDLTSLLPLVILICVATICFCFNSFAFGLCILSHALLTVISTTGLLGYIGLEFNSVSVIAPLVVVIIAVANSVHIISIYKQQLQLGKNYADAMAGSIAYNLKPISLATLTTAIGFLSLNTCSSPAIKDFGNIVALGISIAFLLTFTFLPSLLVWISARIPSHGQNSDPGIIRSLVTTVKLAWVRWDKLIFWGCSLFALFTIALLPLNETDFNRLDFIDRDSELREFYDAVSVRLNRGPVLTYGIDAGTADAAIDPAFLQNLDQFSLWLQTQPEVQSANSLVDLVKTIHRARMGQDPDYYTIPADAITIATDLDVYASIEFDDFPLQRFISEDFSTVKLLISAVPMSNQDTIALDEVITAGFAEHFTDARLIHGSSLLLFARMDEVVTTELLQGYSLSLLLITLTLIVGFRSWYYGLLSIIPNLFPATMVFGLWGLFIGQLDPFVMMLFSISIGMVVDDTVHLLTHYLEHREQGMTITNSVNGALDTTGPALIVTTAVLALGTTILITASTLYFQQAAKLLVPIVVLALLLDLLYLPTILKRFDRRQKSAADVV